MIKYRCTNGHVFEYPEGIEVTCCLETCYATNIIVPGGPPLPMVCGSNASVLQEETKLTTTPFDDPIVQACVEHGGHFWPEDAPENEPSTCTRCWYDPGWVAGKPRDETDLRVVRDEPQA